MATDLDIARATKLKPIAEIAARAGIESEAVIPYGKYKAKIDFDFIETLKSRPDGALVLVAGISPTPAGEGKTTTTIGLADALAAGGAKTMICLREPSLGPCFGMKGGATGGGQAQVAPMEEINLHFTGDFHAITAAANLLAAMVDNHIYWGNALGLDPRRIFVRRALDVNDRALRQIITGLGDGANGPAREQKFDITVASEVMAIFCLARDLDDLIDRLGRIVVAERRDGSLITARDLKADGAMAALLRDAMMPNLVQSLAGTPALVHGGPFANIAHGCNSVIATRTALKLADVVVTEAGFGADLGAEKFLDIKSRIAGLSPDCAVVVATIRALKMQDGIAKADLSVPNVDAVARGVVNLARHVENLQKFGLPVVVALNAFTTDTEAERQAVRSAIAKLGVQVAFCTHWADGAAGTAELAAIVQNLIAAREARFAPIYQDALPLVEKLSCIAREIYRAEDIAIDPKAAKKLAKFTAQGFGHLPVCIAKTQYSFTADPTRLGAPSGFTLPIREVRLCAGAGFVVALSGDIMTMPGLPKVPAAETIGLDEKREIYGLF